MKAVAQLQVRQLQASLAPRGNRDYVQDLVHDSSPPDPAKVRTLMTGLHMAYECLKRGTGTSDDVVSLGLMLNVGVVRADSIGQALVKAFEDAGTALQECEAIKERHGRYGFTGPGLLQMNAALELYEEVLAMSSPNQMQAAEQEVMRQMRAHAAEALKANP